MQPKIHFTFSPTMRAFSLSGNLVDCGIGGKPTNQLTNKNSSESRNEKAFHEIECPSALIEAKLCR